MSRAVWDKLIEEARITHQSMLGDFCEFPDDLAALEVSPHRIGAADLFEAEEEKLIRAHPLAQAFYACSPYAHWRETYRGSQICADFLDRFGCFCLVGQGGAFISKTMSAYVVYMPPNLDYPAHQHPAEETYLILAGSAEFRCGDNPPKTLRAGQKSRHRSNQPHATWTSDEAVIAYVVWKGDLSTKPVWTEAALR